MRTYKKQTTNILARVDKYKREKKEKRRLIYSVSTVAACLALVIIGITVMPNLLDRNIHIPTEPNINNSIDSGVHIPATELPKLDGNIALDMIGLVVYNGRIYTQAEYLRCDAETKKSFIGNYLGTASGTIDEWSSKSEYDTEFASNAIGDVYTIKGYDKDFRICIPEMHDGTEFIAFFENLNGITLTKGEDLYGESRLKLKGNYNDVEYQLYDDWNYVKENFKHFTDVTDGDIEKFIDALYESPFVDLSEAKTDIYDMNLKQTFLYFRLMDGTTIGLRLFENGYVGYDNMSARVFVKIDDDIFQKIFSASIK